jgi:hypothetical protein
MRYIGTTPNQYGDTLLTSDANDQINVKVAGAEDFRIAANTLSVLSGTTLNIDSGATIANSGTATGFGGVDTSGTPANNQLAIFTDADTVEGSSNLTYDGTDLILAGGNINVDSGKGIDFSATADEETMSSELFDDYEAGTYLPTFNCSTSGYFTPNGGYNTLAYTKIGQHMFIHGYIALTSETSPVGTILVGLPTTPADYGMTDSCMQPTVIAVHGDAGIESPVMFLNGPTPAADLYNVTDAGEFEVIDASRVDGVWGVYVNFNYISS